MDAYMQQPECTQALDKMLDEALLLADKLDDLQEVSTTCSPPMVGLTRI
jgi:hypothetical protein